LVKGNIIDSRKKTFQKISRRARGGAENEALLLKSASSIMLSYSFINKISMKEELGFRITYIPLRPLRLCVMNFKRIPLKLMLG